MSTFNKIYETDIACGLSFTEILLIFCKILFTRAKVSFYVIISVDIEFPMEFITILVEIMGLIEYFE